MPEPIFVRGCAFSLGSPQPVESLLKDGTLSALSYEDCIGRGITTFCAGDRPIATLSAVAVAETLSRADIAPEEIPRVVLKAQDCNAFAAGIEAAAEQIARGAADPVLLVLAGHAPDGTSRYSPQLGTVFGDGAAACIVGSKRAGLEVIAVRSWMRPRLPQPLMAAHPGEQMLEDFQGLRNLLRTTYESAAISPADVAAVFGTHGSRIYLELMAEAADVPYEKVYARAMEEFGHVLACDNLVALAHSLQHPSPQRNRVFCLIGWSPASAGVVLLKELG